jgi:TolA-binding protein
VDRAPAGGGREATRTDPSAEPAPRIETELGSQNRLFAEAMDAREQGDPARAARLLDDFVRRYPASPLTQDAYVERFRTLAQLGDRPAASRAARAYLALYRSGFARDEARALALDR